MHLPEPAMRSCPLRRLGSAFGIGMHLSQGKIAENEPEIPAKVLLNCLDDRVRQSAGRALVVAVFNERYWSLGIPLNMVVRTHRDFQSGHDTSPFFTVSSPFAPFSKEAPHAAETCSFCCSPSRASRMPSAPGLTAIGDK